MLELIDAFQETNHRLQATYEQCHDDANLALSRLYFEGEPLDADTINSLANLALTSTVNGDYERTQTYIDAVRLQQANCPPPPVAKALLAGGIAQIIPNTELRGGLLLDHGQKNLMVTGSEHSPLISTLTAASAEHGLDPSEWLDGYQLPPTLRWEVEAGHYQRVTQDASKYESHGAEQATLFAYGDYLNKSSEDLDTEVHQNALYLLNSVPDPDTRAQLVTRFIETSKRTSYELPDTDNVEDAARESYLANKLLNELLATSMAIIQNPMLATPNVIEALDAQIRCALTERYMGNDSQGSYPSIWLQRWDLLLYQAIGAPLEDLIIVNDIQNQEQIKSLEKAALVKDLTPEKLQSYKEFFFDYRDTNLMLLASQCAQKGSFEDAKNYVAGIGNQVILEQAFYSCLAAAQNDEQVKDFAPDPLMVSLNPVLGTYLQIERARFIQDSQEAYKKVHGLAYDLAAKIKASGESPSQIEAKGFVQLYDILKSCTNSEGEHVEFVDTTLKTLRQERNVPYYSQSMRMLSRIALELGYDAEADQAQDYIKKYSDKDPAETLKSVAVLATSLSQLVRKRYSYLVDYLA